jgi:two-component system sensor histidine kinase VicK
MHFSLNVLEATRYPAGAAGDRSLPTTGEFTMLALRPLLPPSAVRAHALKNCLSIVCAVNTLVEGEVGEASQRRLSRSQQAVRRMLELLEEELRPTGLERSPSRADFISAVQVLDEVRGRVEDLAQAKGVRLLFRAGPGDIYAEPSTLAEALGNIVMNAIESSASGAIVVVTSDESSEQGQLFTVRDTGDGIPEQDLRRLGTPFHSGRQGGSGLGIAVARDVVERHGGLAHIESAPGAGTLVSIWLPRGESR